MARKSLTDRGIRALKPHAVRYSQSDPQLAGHFIRVTPNNVKTYICVARNPDGKQVWTTIGNCEVMPVEEARARAREYLQRVRDGQPAIAAKGETFGAVAANWIKRHVEPNGLRSEHEITRLLKANIFPRWKDRAFLEIRRSDVAALLDHVEDNHGGRQADYVLAIVRGIMNWYATRHDDYVPVVVKGMQRTSAKQRERERILDDDELRAIWRAAEANGTYGALIRLLLLTGQRRDKVVSMRWADISEEGEWNIATADREKGNAGFLLLPKAALDIIAAQPRMGSNPYVFAGRGDKHVNGFSKSKTAFDAKLAKMPQWQLHDLRRTARSLMSRAGVPENHAERVLGHVQPGVRGVYDRFQYRDEKADALLRLATLIGNIVNPPDRSKVTPIARAKRITR
jgi:integrase